MTLDQLRPGETGVIQSVNAPEALHRRLMDMGLVEGTCIQCLFTGPGGDPRAFLIRGAVIALRTKDLTDIHLKT